MVRRPTTKEILEKYSRKVSSEINNYDSYSNFFQESSKEYEQFKEQMTPENSTYTRWAKTLGNFLKIKLSEKEQAKMQNQLSIAHVNVTPSQALTLSIFSMLLIFFITFGIGISIYLITAKVQLLLIFLGLVTSIFVFYYTYTMPQRLANAWRLKTSSQMVPAILYIVVYMRHTSNLERAVQFASQHLEEPLALDFKKIIYDVEIGRFSSIKQSLDNYLESWRNYAPEFIESFHLIESSLYEPSETRRIIILEKSLQVILDGVYEKMLKYSRSIRSPLTNLYMLGVILPTLGLALLPLASTLLGGVLRASHVFVIFNIITPFFVFYMTSEVLLKRPGGHGETSALRRNPDYYKFTAKSPWFLAFFITLPLLIIGLIPFLFQLDFITAPLNLQSDYTFADLGLPFLQDTKLFDFKTTEAGAKTGPYSPISIIFSLFLPLSIALFFAITYKKKTYDLIKARNQTKTLEQEFTNSIFQLGNRLADGTPAEIAFSRVAASTVGQKTHDFFSLVNQNIQQLGMSIEDAIFNPKRGAIIYFPSSLIATSMRILVESVKKGLKIAARSMMSISEYVKNIQKISERLRDLLAEIVSDMKSNMIFLAPLLAGIVVGLASMITTILNKLKDLTDLGAGSQEIVGLGSISNITSIFDITSIISPYLLQASIGIYIIEISFILTSALVTIDSGKDSLEEKFQLSKNLKRGILIYFFTCLFSIAALTILASVALGDLV